MARILAHLFRAKRWLLTRRCGACRQHYPRKLPNCPVCKNRPGFIWDELDERGLLALGMANIGGPHR